MMKIALMLLMAVAVTTSTAYALNPYTMSDCTTHNNLSDMSACHNGIMTHYEATWDILQSNIGELKTMQTKYNALEADYNILKIQYAQLLQQGNSTVQVGNSTMQDQIANLTARVSAVETKADRNESLIHIVHNKLRTAQADIADIYLKINSVR